LSGDEANVRHFEFATIIDSEALRFIVAILNHPEADEIVWAQSLLVVQYRHGVCAHDRVAGCAQEWLLDRRSSRNVLKWTAILCNYARHQKKKEGEEAA
jgi:hypothetical protein